MEYTTLRRLCAVAIANGALRRGPTHIEWEMAGDCLTPAYHTHYACPAGDIHPEVVPFYIGETEDGEHLYGRSRVRWTQGRRYAWRPGKSQPLLLEMSSRCRKCERCLRLRSRMWTARSVSETRMSSRTWFGTLTLRPGEQYLAKARASHVMSCRNGIDFDTLSPKDQFGLIVAQIGQDVTKYLKRIRKESGVRFRYLVVFEAHASGDPHIHMLLHELHADMAVRQRTLEGQWKLGFTKWRLVDTDQPGAAGYVCKYLSKTAAARVRASRRYGGGRFTETTGAQTIYDHSVSVSDLTPLVLGREIRYMTDIDKKRGLLEDNGLSGSIPKGTGPTGRGAIKRGDSVPFGEAGAVRGAGLQSAGSSGASSAHPRRFKRARDNSRLDDLRRRRERDQDDLRRLGRAWSDAVASGNRVASDRVGSVSARPVASPPP